MTKPVRLMTDDELTAELARLGEGDRAVEIKAEKTRRLISLDGDIGRREDRSR